MKLPYILSPFYRFMRANTPEEIKPTVRGIYNMLNKYVTYGRTDIFTALDIEINSKCNLKCSYCPISTETRGDEYMSEQLFRKILDDLSCFPYSGRISPHFYGEPTLDKRLIDLMRIAREKLPMAQIIVHTNGIKLDRQTYRQLIKAGVNGFLITKHTPNWPKNVLDIYHNETSARKYLRMHDLKKNTLFNRGGTVTLKKARTMNRCFYLSDEIAITHTGEVVCTNDFHITESFGNVTTSHLLNDIWWGEHFSSVRKELQAGTFRFEVCKVCSGQSKIKPVL